VLALARILRNPRQGRLYDVAMTTISATSRGEPLLVSIVVRNYNYAAFLPDAIDSALAQTYPRVEVVVVDDGSTDGSRAVLEDYRNRCVIVLQPNGGEGAGINAGFAACRGDVVIYLDSDDVLFPWAVADVMARWRPGLARLHYRLWTMLEDGTVLNLPLPPFEVPALSVEEHLYRYGQVVSGGQSFNAYARWALASILPLDASTWLRAPDTYLNALTTVMGEVDLIQEPLGGYRRHTHNLSLQNSARVAQRDDVVRIHPDMYAAVARFVGPARWTKFRPRAPTYHWLNRILSRRLNEKGHPYPGDRLPVLVANAIRRIATVPNVPRRRRLFLTGAVLAATLLPRSLLRRALPRMLEIARRMPPLPPGTMAVHWRSASRARSGTPVM